MERHEIIAAKVHQRTARPSVNLTGLAHTLGISRQALNRRLHKGGWKYEELVRLAEALDMTIDQLITNEDSDDIVEADLTFEYFHASDQPVNQGPRGVKLIHKPTGAVIISNKEKSQLENKVVTLRLLRLRLLESDINGTSVTQE